MVDQSRRLTIEASIGGVEQRLRRKWHDGRAPSLRQTLVDLIEDCVRQFGHADLIRESVDAAVGENPPGIHE